MRHLAAVLCLVLAVPTFAQSTQPDGKPWPTVTRQVVTPISPFFPESERSKGTRKGVVELELTINPAGIVQIVKVVKSAGAAFDEQAQIAAKLTVFAPEKTMTIQNFTVTFELR
ncbi:MAG: TonB family protein [Archangium sp.]|nr:TonB family protein [Archangium sp.]